jgi:hypothetical protein
MIPWWKVRREAVRIGVQASQFPWFVFGTILRNRYDRDRGRLVRVKRGEQALHPDVAVILIYQPKGILASFIDELRHFDANGFSTVVVSNAPLDDENRSRLAAHAHLVIERPNYGYDFGGYREGIMTLAERGIRPRNLVVKNDSVWFPLRPGCDFLKRAVAEPCDLYGIYSNTRYAQTRKHHLQSYFYRFGPRLAASEHFARYWEYLTMTNNKHMVIRQNEMKLTGHFGSLGYSSAALIDYDILREATFRLSDADLLQVIAYQARVETRAAPFLAPLVAEGTDAPGWRHRVERVWAGRSMGAYLMIAHPLVLVGMLDCPILKKDRQPIYRLQRRELVETGLADRLTPAVRRDIADWDGP